MGDEKICLPAFNTSCVCPDFSQLRKKQEPQPAAANPVE